MLDTASSRAYQRPDELHQSFFFEFLRAPWDAASFAQVIDRGLGDRRRPRLPRRLGAEQPRHAAFGHPVRRRRPRHRPRRHRPRPDPRPRGRAADAGAAGIGVSLPGRGARPARGHRPARTPPHRPDVPPHRRRPARPRRLPGSRCPGRRAADVLRLLPRRRARLRRGCRSPTGSPTTPSTGSSTAASPCCSLYREALALRHRVPATLGRTVPLVAHGARRARLHPRRRLRLRGQLLAPAGLRAPGSRPLLGSNPEVGEKLPPDSAVWSLLEGEA